LTANKGLLYAGDRSKAARLQTAGSRQGSDRGLPTFAFGHFRMVAKGDAKGDAEVKAI